MKKIIVILIFASCILNISAQNSLSELPNFERYKIPNEEILSMPAQHNRVVFIGNSITDAWPEVRPDFFKDNNYVGRGIGGQTSPQLLLRFRKDVIELKPQIVVINIGTNDIAENTGKYNPQYTLDNIMSMTDIALANGVKVILSSVLPVGEYPWRKDIKNASQIVDSLNAAIRNYAVMNDIPYADYNANMRDSNGALIEDLGHDGVHPVEKGYKVMETVIQPIIKSLLRK
ncbi:GDSL-type esterase/lipase family protein [Dysgonomonas massiliensis]|uniref:GDSL-type esterase/lipase family protein n=1 Tax=Dysgonomonas massiliensis TaxID=2040292 RepID=UPI000C790549|nr:GDSL-type esterase/lipase family protein [Dysgonomonas massiliensis]